MVENEEHGLTTIFKEIIARFINKLSGTTRFDAWCKLIQYQFKELTSFLEKSVKSSDNASTSNIILTPHTPASTKDLSGIKKFSPLVNENSKLTCSIAGCKSRFAHKRSYRKHIREFHQNAKPDQSKKDPPGTCEMIFRETGLPCKAKLPRRSITYHLTHMHGVEEPPENHVLLGFDMTSTPRPVFVPRGDETYYAPRLYYTENVDQDNQDVASEQVPSESQDTSDTSSLDSNPYNPEETKITQYYTTTPSVVKRMTLKRKLPTVKEMDFSDDSEGMDEDKGERTKPPMSVLHDISNYDLDSILDLPTQPLDPTLEMYQSQDFQDFQFDSQTSQSQSIKSKEESTEEVSQATSDEDTNQVSLKDMIDDTNFTDVEEEDDETYTENRKKNKDLRHKNRNTSIIPLHLQDENKNFINDFEDYLRRNLISTSNPKVSTISKALSHLFEKEDSLLYFEKEKDQHFNLENWRKLDSDSFVHITYPADWIITTAGRDGNKGLDRLKCHKDLREFLEHQADSFNSKEDYSFLKNSVRCNLSAIDKQISGNKLWKKYQDLSIQKSQKKAKAKMILQPSRQMNVQNIIRTWNNSLEKQEIDDDFEYIYKTAYKSGDISVKNLTSYSNYARITLLMRLDCQKFAPL